MGASLILLLYIIHPGIIITIVKKYGNIKTKIFKIQKKIKTGLYHHSGYLPLRPTKDEVQNLGVPPKR